MLICCQRSAGNACAVGAPATITRPSAGDSTAVAAAATLRSGSRKKNRKNAGSTSSDDADDGPDQPERRRGARTSRRGRTASRPGRCAYKRESEFNCPRTRRGPTEPGCRDGTARGTSGCRRVMAARVLARDLLHLILEGEFPLLQGDFFDLFGVGEVVPFGEFVEAVVELVVAFGELAVLVVARAAGDSLPPALPLRSWPHPPFEEERRRACHGAK